MIQGAINDQHQTCPKSYIKNAEFDNHTKFNLSSSYKASSKTLLLTSPLNEEIDNFNNNNNSTYVNKNKDHDIFYESSSSNIPDKLSNNLDESESQESLCFKHNNIIFVNDEFSNYTFRQTNEDENKTPKNNGIYMSRNDSDKENSSWQACNNQSSKKKRKKKNYKILSSNSMTTDFKNSINTILAAINHLKNEYDAQFSEIRRNLKDIDQKIDLLLFDSVIRSKGKISDKESAIRGDILKPPTPSSKSSISLKEKESYSSDFATSKPQSVSSEIILEYNEKELDGKRDYEEQSILTERRKNIMDNLVFNHSKGKIQESNSENRESNIFDD